ncbi:MAG: sensor signal transduction histidine kinase [Dehalococcoidia bacterium]|nr:sensor signal transduction histidine kinase [Dehalococcoidia bacterium]
MGLWFARILPPLAVAVAIVSLDYVRHILWHPLDTWSVFLLAVTVASVAAYILGEFLMRFFTHRYTTSVRIAAEIARLPSALEQIGESTQPQQRAAAKQELLRMVAKLAGADGAAFFATEANMELAKLDAAYGVPEGGFPQSISWSGSNNGGSQAPSPERAIATLSPALWGVGFSSVNVLPLRSGNQTVGYLALAGRRKLREWLSWKEATDLVESQVGGILRNLQLAGEGQVIATLRERDRIAREMHDSLAQTLTYIRLEAQAGLLAAQCREIDAAMRDQLENIATAALEGYRDIRTSILDLRREQVKGQDFLELLEQYLQRFARDTGISAELVVEPGATTRFIAPTEIQLLRVVQEALTNVRKHARAKRVKVTFCNKSGAPCLCIQDDGVGFSVAPVIQRGSGFGLVSMRERLQEIGGDLVIDSSPGMGTHIQARVPPVTHYALGG